MLCAFDASSTNPVPTPSPEPFRPQQPEETYKNNIPLKKK